MYDKGNTPNTGEGSREKRTKFGLVQKSNLWSKSPSVKEYRNEG